MPGFPRWFLFQPFNLHLDFWKSRSWKIKVCFKPWKNFRSCKPGFFSRSPPRKKLDLYHKPEKKISWQTEKKSRCAGPEIFLRFETDLNFQKSRCRLKGCITQYTLHLSTDYKVNGQTVTAPLKFYKTYLVQWISPELSNKSYKVTCAYDKYFPIKQETGKIMIIIILIWQAIWS